jgi:hypothetical protein
MSLETSSGTTVPAFWYGGVLGLRAIPPSPFPDSGHIAF